MGKNPKPHELRIRKNRIALDLERIEHVRPVLPERHLFVTEGTKTEPLYLQGMVDLIGERYGHSAKKQFRIIGEGDNTLYLLRKAEAYQQSEADDFQHVWIIYDKDDFPPDDFDNTVSRCEALNRRFRKNGRDLKFHALWSNQCIELWFLLHFIPLEADITREQYRTKLSEHLGRHYEKSDNTIFYSLLPHMNNAIKNAHNLMKSYDPKLSPSQKAPSTTVYQLLEKLKSYIQ